MLRDAISSVFQKAFSSKKARKTGHTDCTCTTVNFKQICIECGFIINSNKVYQADSYPVAIKVIFWGERRLGIRLRFARGLMGREEGKIAIFPSSLPVVCARSHGKGRRKNS